MNQKLALVALREAKKNYHGNTVAAIGNLQPIAELFEGEAEANVDVLEQDWGGGFVYLCAVRAGFSLPPRYPDHRVGTSFARAEAWERYARLPKIGAWLTPDSEPEPGDIVVIEPKAGERLPSVGIILAVGEDAMDTAEGNYHNHSASNGKAMRNDTQRNSTLPQRMDSKNQTRHVHQSCRRRKLYNQTRSKDPFNSR